MTFLRGIGEKTATNFLVEMGGDIRRFKITNKLCHGGIDPAIYQSGKHDGARQDHQRETVISDE